MTVEELLKELGVGTAHKGEHHHAREGWLQVESCPFCGSHNYHLGYNLANQVFFCFRCRFHRTVDTLLALGATMGQVGACWGAKGKARAQATQAKTPRGGLKEPKFRGPLLPQHKEYLESRGFVPEEIQKLWEVEGIGLHPHLAWRLYIPIVQDGKRVSWTTRSISSKVEQRYISATAAQETVSLKECLYGEQFVGHSVVVVEGPTDAWNVGLGAAAVLGTGYTTAQVGRIAKYPFRYVVFDNAPTAQAVAEALCQELSCLPGVTEKIELDAADPGSASAREIRLLRKACKL